MTATHRDIPDEVVKRAQLYDYGHRPPAAWGWLRVSDDQVRRLLWGAYGSEGDAPAGVRLRTSLTTRQGRKVPRMLYQQLGDEPADDDPIIGLVDTPGLAAVIVAAVNAWSLHAEIREGIAEAGRGETEDLGSFAQFGGTGT